MAEFAPYAIDIVIHHEAYERPDGSWLYWVNDPNDHGGETAWGVSTLIISRENISAETLGVDPDRLERHIATWQAKEAKQPLPNPEPEGILKDVTLDSAQSIYQMLYWDRYGYGAIADQVCATKIFDFAVNAGAKQAALEAQRACNHCGSQLTEDGSLGPLSFGTINAISPKVFLQAYALRMTLYYDLIIAQHPTYAAFRDNWHKRAAWMG